MLHVEGGDYRDPVVDKILDVLIALVMARSGDVGVRQFVDDCDRRLALKNGIDVHLFKRNAAIRELFQRNLLEIADARRGLDATMGFDKADNDIVSLLAQLMRLLEHPVGFADAGSTAQINLQPSLPRLRHLVEKMLPDPCDHHRSSWYAALCEAVEASRTSSANRCQRQRF